MNNRELLTAILAGNITREQLNAPATRFGRLNLDGTITARTLAGERNFTPKELAGCDLPFIFNVIGVEHLADLIPHRTPERVLITSADLESDPLD